MTGVQTCALPIFPELHNNDSGGAQYLMKNVTPEFWEKVEDNSEKLFTEISDLSNHKVAINRHTVLPGEPTQEQYHPLQIWCADMWAVLWNIWYFGYEAKVNPYFNFCWPTQSIEEWDNNLIFHNAGVTEAGNLFYKASYINDLPFSLENTFDPKFCSYAYFSQIADLKNRTVLI